MSALTVYNGLAVRFATVSGLKAIILGEPTAAHETPCLYTAFERFERPMTGSPPADNLVAMRYFFTHRLVIRWQDNAEAELTLLTLLNAIPAAVDADPHLGGVLNKGVARISNGIAGFALIGSTKYRVVDYGSDVLEKAARSSNL